MALLCIGTSGRLEPAGQAMVLKGHSHAFSVNEALTKLQAEVGATRNALRTMGQEARQPELHAGHQVLVLRAVKSQVEFQGKRFLDLLERLTLPESP